MNTPLDPGSIELLRIGPIKVVEVFTSPTPTDIPVANSTTCDSVPFSDIKHLCSGKPLARFTPADRNS